MTRAEAEDYLRSNGSRPGDFVVRESAANGNFVLSVLTDSSGHCEHHKLYLDAQGRFMLDGQLLRRECRSLQDVINHLSTEMDGTTVLLALSEDDGFYGVKKPVQVNLGGDFYGAASQAGSGAETDDFYGGLMQKQPAWLKGEMARQDAEALLLRNPRAGAFLVRESKARKGTFAISLVIDDGRVEHHSLRYDQGCFLLNEAPLSALCSTLPQVVSHLSVYREAMSRTLVLEDPEDDGTYGNVEFPEPIVAFSNPGYAREFGDRSENLAGQYDDLSNPPQEEAPARPIKYNPGYLDPHPPPTIPLTAPSVVAAAAEEDQPPLPAKSNGYNRLLLSSMREKVPAVSDGGDDEDAPPVPLKSKDSIRRPLQVTAGSAVTAAADEALEIVPPRPPKTGYANQPPSIDRSRKPSQRETHA